jgi:hypothetical protein
MTRPTDRTDDANERKPAGRDDTQLSGVGCVVTLLSLAVICGAAIPIVRWRDPDTGAPLPRDLAIIAPVLIGATFQGICALLLRLVGLRIWSKSEQDGSAPSNG